MIPQRNATNQNGSLRAHTFPSLAGHEQFPEEKIAHKGAGKILRFLAKHMNEKDDYLFLKYISKDLKTFLKGFEGILVMLLNSYTMRGNELLEVPGRMLIDMCFSSATSAQLEQITMQVLQGLNRIKQLMSYNNYFGKQFRESEIFETLISIMRYTIRADIAVEILTFFVNLDGLPVHKNRDIREIKPYLEVFAEIDWLKAAKTLPEVVNCAEFIKNDEHFNLLKIDKKLAKKLKGIPVEDIRRFGKGERSLNLELNVNKRNRAPDWPVYTNDEMTELAVHVLIYNFLGQDTFQRDELINIATVCHSLNSKYFLPKLALC